MKDFEPHPSHDMEPWRNTVVTLVSTSRFGSIRKCRNCGAEHAKTAAGEDHHEELESACPEAKEEAEVNVITPDEIRKKEYKGNWRAALLTDMSKAYNVDFKWDRLILFCIEEYHGMGTDLILTKFEELQEIVEQL